MSKSLEKALAERKKLFLLYGQEQYLLEKNTEKVIAAYLQAEEMDLNLEVLEALPKDMYELLNKCDTLPFMAEYRVIVLKDTGIFEYKDKNALDSFAQKIERLPESTVLIIKEKTVDKRKKLFKLFQTIGFLEEYNFLEEEQLIQFLGKWFYRYDLRIKTATARLLLQRAGIELSGLLKECEKLASLAEDTITDELVTALVAERLESKIFQLTDALAKRDRQAAMENYHIMLQNRESPNGILFMIGRQIRQITIAKGLAAGRASSAEAAKLLGVPSFVVNKLMAQARLFSQEELNLLLKEILQLEWDFKRGRAELETGIALLIIGATQKV